MAFSLGGMIGGGIGLGGDLFNYGQNRAAANQFFSEGDPYRSQLRAITNDPNLYFNGPIAQALANQSDRRYSALVGNPAGSGTAQAGALEAMLRGYGNERDRLFQMGGGDYWNRAYPQTQLGSAQLGRQGIGGLGSLVGSGANYLFGAG